LRRQLSISPISSRNKLQTRIADRHLRFPFHQYRRETNEFYLIAY
jgi:hypothetical protein